MADDNNARAHESPQPNPALGSLGFKGKFSDDFNTVAGRWEWPGGGYEATMTRAK